MDDTFKDKFANQIETIIKLSDYSILLNLILSDIAVCARNNVNATIEYEILHSTKLMVIVLNEAFKKLYNFDNENDPINMSKYPKGSFFVRIIGTIVKNELPSVLPDYNAINSSLKDFNNQELWDLKAKRDLSIHYDKSAKEVYDMLNSLDVIGTFQLSITLMQIIKDMLSFIQVISTNYSLKMIELKDAHFNYHNQWFEDKKLEYVNEPLKLAETIEGQKRLFKIRDESQSIIANNQGVKTS